MTEQPPVRTYGGWRRRRGLGLMGLSTGQTMAVLGAVTFALILATAAPVLLLVVGPLLALGVGLMVARWDGVPLVHRIVGQVRWQIAVARGWTRLTGGVLVEHPRAWQLPGVLAPMVLVDVEDGAGGRFGLVWDRHSGLVTATVRVAATSTWLAGSDADGWVAAWGGWLAGLGYVPAVRWVAVTVDTAPDPGSTLRDRVLGGLDPQAPAAARAIVTDLVAAAPHSAADVDTRISVTFDPRFSPTRPGTVLDTAVEFSRLLDGLEIGLGGCGVTVLGRASAADLAGAVRVAFDPAARGQVGRLLDGTTPGRELLTWADAGPVAAQETWEAYRHDSGTSTSWGWREAPRQLVHADVLSRLLAPGAWPTRTTMLYRPLAAGAAARLLETEANAASFRAAYRARTGRDTQARDSVDAAAASRAAREEAQGAGVVLMSMYVTTTVLDPADLVKAASDVETRADSAKIRLRRLYGAQAAGFAATLPCGLHPAVLATRWPH